MHVFNPTKKLIEFCYIFSFIESLFFSQMLKRGFLLHFFQLQ